eukprot:437962_1
MSTSELKNIVYALELLFMVSFEEDVSNVLQQLFDQDTETDSDDLLEQCPHYKYSSSHNFVDHLLVLLNAEVKAFDECTTTANGDLLFWLLAEKGDICIDCCNILLSAIHFNTFIRDYIIPNLSFAEPSEDDKYFGLFNLAKFSFWFICDQVPKVHKIIWKCMKLNKETYIKGEQLIKTNNLNQQERKIYAHVFHFICTIAVSGESSHFSHFRNVFLSIKYWNVYQIIFFINHHYIDLFKFIIGSSNADPKEAHLPTVMLCTISNKYHKLPERYVSLIDENLQDMIFINIDEIKMYKEYRAKLRSDMRVCGFCEIVEGSGEDNVTGQKKSKYKICKQCKMTYYCSRNCQKKSWNKRHREVCEKLLQMYCL